MPANPKYLNPSLSQRIAKISASIIGGFLIAAALHLCLAVWMPIRRDIFATYTFSLFLVWCTLMIFPFLFKNGWNCWILYGIIFLVIAGTTVLGAHTHG